MRVAFQSPSVNDSIFVQWASQYHTILLYNHYEFSAEQLKKLSAFSFITTDDGFLAVRYLTFFVIPAVLGVIAKYQTIMTKNCMIS